MPASAADFVRSVLVAPSPAQADSDDDDTPVSRMQHGRVTTTLSRLTILTAKEPAL
jgi:hypothetical protein